MKSLIQTITLVIGLTLVTGNFVQGQSVLEDTEREMAESQRKMIEAQREIAESQREISKVQWKEFDVQHIGKLPKGSVIGSVLVIPSAEAKVEDMVGIMEDMNVMSRIFDKKLEQAQMMPGWGLSGRSGYSYGGGGGFMSGIGFMSSGGRGIQSIYLEGYGALFLLNVDIPLFPPAQVEEEKEQVEEPADPIWEQAKREIYEPTDVGSRTRPRRSEQQSEYDAEKVEELKSQVIKALKHTSNIRALKPTEWIIVTVRENASQSVGTIASRIFTVKTKDAATFYEKPIPTEVGFSWPAVLIMRVKKSDADAYANDELDGEQFRQRVQIFTY